MIVRTWHGIATKEKAPLYEQFIKEEIFQELSQNTITGFKEIQLLKRESGNEIEFTTIMWFENIDAVKQFAGEDYEKAHVPEKARALLSSFDSKSIHSDLTLKLIP
jgi:antibiotic biosynthesis monooxygenase (ABM) superfamily enzyme